MTKTIPMKLQRILQRLFAQQAREVASKLDFDRGAPDMSHWTDVIADAVRPLLLADWQRGMVQAGARIARSGKMKGVVNRSRSRMVLVTKRKKDKEPPLAVDIDLFEPKVLDAVDQSVYAFCRETMDTATGDLRTALDRLRQLMREGLPRGDAVKLMARNVREIFADPMRAFRIATTETSRAMHAGARMAADESGVVSSWSWLASSDACELCLSLDGKTVKKGQPYIVLPGKPPYNVVYHPPAHPHCFCDETENI